MISGFNISQHEWDITPSPVHLATLSLNHQLRLLQIETSLQQTQFAALKKEICESERQRDEQQLENERLANEAARLKESIGLNSANSNLPPSSDSKAVGAGLLEQTKQLFELWQKTRDGMLQLSVATNVGQSKFLSSGSDR